MLDLALKNIRRQRTRTILTTLGIVIGIAAIIALGSVAEGINSYVQGSLELSAGKIVVQQKGSGGFMSGFAGSDITDEQIEDILGIDGVKEVTPVNLYYVGGMGLGGGPELVVAGIDPTKSESLVGENVEMYDGRDIDDGERGVVILGKTLAEDKDLAVGDYLTIKDEDFEVVGIIELTNNANVDGSAVVNIKDLQELLDMDTYQTLYVTPFDIRDSEVIAEKIEDDDESLSALTSKDLARQASQVIDQIRMFTFGIGAIAAVVGGLGVLNTMIMSVMERRREIGVMKALGASSGMVLRQILTESAAISVLGGIAGIALGTLATLGLVMASGGDLPARVTPELALGGLIFALFLGLAGGIYPAWKAARLDPVVALRYE